MDGGVRKCSRHGGRNKHTDGWGKTSGWMGGRRNGEGGGCVDGTDRW